MTLTNNIRLGYADFSEWFIGHSGSIYWTKKDSEKARDISQNRTLLDISEYTTAGKTRGRYSKLEELEALNQVMGIVTS